jgi:hypothetical protein
VLKNELGYVRVLKNKIKKLKEEVIWNNIKEEKWKKEISIELK